LLGLSRSSLYYQPGGGTAEDLRLMRKIDEQYTACPFYGSRRMTVWLTNQGEEVNRKRVQRLMRVMGLEAIYPKPRLRVYPGIVSCNSRYLKGTGCFNGSGLKRRSMR
jgi:putative transposase